jgi:hypothetical protein
MVDYSGIILGAIIAIFSSIIGDMLRWQYIEKKRLEIEQTTKKQEIARDFFRKNYDKYSHFFAVQSEFEDIDRGILNPELMSTPSLERELKFQADKLIELIPDLLESYGKIIDTGYLAVLPDILQHQFKLYGRALAQIGRITERKNRDFTTFSDLEWFNYSQVFRFGKHTRHGFRQLLGVEALDGLITSNSPSDESELRSIVEEFMRRCPTGHAIVELNQEIEEIEHEIALKEKKHEEFMEKYSDVMEEVLHEYANDDNQESDEEP